MRNSLRILMGSCVFLLLGVSSFGAPAGSLQVGAAKVDITPAPDAALTMGGYANRTHGFEGIHDHIYVRAIVLSDGTHQIAVVTWELVSVPNQVWDDLSQRVSKELGIPADNLLVAAVHDHSAPVLVGGNAPGGQPPSPGNVAYTTKVENGAIEALRRAQASLQPAKFGFGTGKAYVNVNRREFYPQKGWFWLGWNPEGPSDKTVAVLKFSDLSGKPIALFIDYAVHCVVMGDDNYAVTGDLAGATSRYVEQYYQGKKHVSSSAGWEMEPRPEERVSGEGPVVIWTSGAAGDQAPITRDSPGDFTMVDGLGRILGDASVRAANIIAAMSSQATLAASQRVISCPGQRLLDRDKHLPRTDYKFEDAAPVNIRLSLLRINDVALAGVSGEVFDRIAEHLKHVSPLGDHTVIVTHANGSSGYIPSDDSFESISYENTASHLKPGCAENGIVNGLLEMLPGQ